MLDQDQPAVAARWSSAKLAPPTSRALLICTGLIALGFVPSPGSWYLPGSERDVNGIKIFLAALQFTALVPFGLTLIVATTRARLPVMLGRVLALLFLPCGLFLTFLSGLADAGTEILFLQGVMLTLACVGALLWIERESPGTSDRAAASIILLVPTVAALWSLAAAAIVLRSAHVIANGQPFCLAFAPEGPDSDGRLAPIGSVADLRWFSFYTTREFTNPGQLTVDTPEGRRTYVWSPWEMQFDLDLRRDLGSYSDPQACLPSPSFWQSA